MSRVPVLKFDGLVIATVQDELTDGDAIELQEQLWSRLSDHGARGVLLDLSIVQIVDSFLGRLLNDVAVGARLLGAETILVGIRPEVAITLVELGLKLPGVYTALNPQRGVALLRRMLRDGVNRGRTA